MAAFNSDIVDALREIQRGISLYPQIEKCIEPFAAGVGMHQRTLKLPLAQLRVPWTHARALKAGTKHDIVRLESLNVRRRQIRAAPVQIVQRAPCLAVAVFCFLLFHVVLLESPPPSP